MSAKKKASQRAALLGTDEERGVVSMTLGYAPHMAKVEIDKMNSRMGRATESHFAVLNTAIIERKSKIMSFDPEKVLNPALRATIKEDSDNKADFVKVKSLFMGEEAKKRYLNRGYISKADN